MPRPLRVEYAGARYHVMCRGNRGEVIFGDDQDRKMYLDTLTEATERTGWRLHAWVLMSTHYHLLLETPEPNLVEGMKWFQGTFTQRNNRYHKTSGHLFQGRYKAKIIDDAGSSYFRKVADYIHLNPAAAGMLGKEHPDLKQYSWSSYPSYLKPPKQRPAWLWVDHVLDAHRIGRDSPKGRKVFEACMDSLVLSVLANKSKRSWKRDWARHEWGWVHGSNEFRERMVAHLREGDEGLLRNVYDGDQGRSYNEFAASEAIAEGLERLKMSRSDLEQLKKGDPQKLLLAGFVKRHFMVTNAWVSEQLNLGHSSRASKAIHLYTNPPRSLKKAKQKLLKAL